MNVVLTDSHDDILRWIFRGAILGVPLVWVLGRTAAIAFAAFEILLFGMWIVGRLGDVARTPFSFCLPGFRESLRRRYFLGAAVMGLGVSLLFSLGPALSFHWPEELVDYGDLTHLCLQVASGFLAGMAGGLITGTPRLILSRLAWSILMLLSIPLFVLAVVAFFAFMDYPAIGILAGTVLCLFVRLRLGDMGRVKRGHRMVIEDALEQQAQAGGTKTASPRVENLFREQMDRRHYLKTGRYIWGGLYEAFGLSFSYWKWNLLALILMALMLAFTGSDMALTAGIILGAPLATWLARRLPTGSSILLPGGRREKCYATLAVAVVASLLLLVAIALVVLLSGTLAPALSSSSSKHEAHGLSAVAERLANTFLLCLLVPTALGMQLLKEHGHHGSAWISCVVLFGGFTLVFFWRSTRPEAPVLTLLVGLLAFEWAFFLFILRTACWRWDLVRR